MDGKTILVVEDNKDMQTIYRDMLEGSYSVLVAGDAQDAMRQLRQNSIDLMVLDIVLPKQRGDEFFSSLKGMPKFKKLKVLCITVLDDVIKKLREIDPGVEFLPKPFRRNELLGAIERMLVRD